MFYANGVTQGMTNDAAVKIQHPFAPGIDRIIWLDQPGRRHYPRPLKGAK